MKQPNYTLARCCENCAHLTFAVYKSSVGRKCSLYNCRCTKKKVCDAFEWEDTLRAWEETVWEDGRFWDEFNGHYRKEAELRERRLKEQEAMRAALLKKRRAGQTITGYLFEIVKDLAAGETAAVAVTDLTGAQVQSAVVNLRKFCPDRVFSTHMDTRATFITRVQ